MKIAESELDIFDVWGPTQSQSVSAGPFTEYTIWYQRNGKIVEPISLIERGRGVFDVRPPLVQGWNGNLDLDAHGASIMIPDDASSPISMAFTGRTLHEIAGRVDESHPVVVGSYTEHRGDVIFELGRHEAGDTRTPMKDLPLLPRGVVFLAVAAKEALVSQSRGDNRGAYAREGLEMNFRSALRRVSSPPARP